MTNREAIEYIERECHTCKGFYAPENECIAVPQDCFESKRLAISALQEREERERGIEMTNKDVPDEVKIAHDENGTPYMLEAFGSEAEHITRLLSAERDNRLIEMPQNTTFKQFIKKALGKYFNITDVYVGSLTRVDEAEEPNFKACTDEVIDDKAEYINDDIETERRWCYDLKRMYQIKEGRRMLEIRPTHLKPAREFVGKYHRHNIPPVGGKFAISCFEGERLCGVAICGRPTARKLDDGATLEIYRNCTDGTRNACTKLYGACVRIARDMGYKKVITYTLESENGASLRAANFTFAGSAGGIAWTGTRRRDYYVSPEEMKNRWEYVF